MRERVVIQPPGVADETAFLDSVKRSRRVHAPWVQPPGTSKAFREYVHRQGSSRHVAFFLWLEEPRGLVGVVNVSEIVLGSFRSAYLGYYAFLPFAGRGLMRQGMAQVVSHAFRTMTLHRLEANIQPANVRSIALVKALGFRLEGFSPRYLKINGRWRDHQRWAILSDDW